MSYIIEEIVSIEWEMFTSVNEGKARASCQEDRQTFEVMRFSQFGAWSAEATASYLDDLKAAVTAGRNLLEEKYINMMKTTQPGEYIELLPRLTLPTEKARALAQELNDILVEQTRALFEDYPYVSGRSRPLYSEFDNYGTSVETYQLGELLTYSEKTLAVLKNHVQSLAENGTTYAKTVLENTVRFYGYESLDAAEAAAKNHYECGGR